MKADWIKRPGAISTAFGLREVCAPGEVKVEVRGVLFRLEINPGYNCDGASLPLWVFGLLAVSAVLLGSAFLNEALLYLLALVCFAPKSRADTAGIVHDFLYGGGCSVFSAGYGDRRYFTRREADIIFRELLKKEKFFGWFPRTRGIMWRILGVWAYYFAVRAAGFLFYKGEKQ